MRPFESVPADGTKGAHGRIFRIGPYGTRRGKVAGIANPFTVRALGFPIIAVPTGQCVAIHVPCIGSACLRTESKPVDTTKKSISRAEVAVVQVISPEETMTPFRISSHWVSRSSCGPHWKSPPIINGICDKFRIEATLIKIFQFKSELGFSPVFKYKEMKIIPPRINPKTRAPAARPG